MLISPSPNQKLKAEKNSTKMEHIHLSFPPIMLQQWLKFYRTPPPKKKSIWIFLKHCNVISFRTTADIVHVHMAVWRIGNPSKQMGCLHFDTLQVVCNSQLLVFYSTKSPTTIHGYATNWNSTSWEEIFPQQSKFSVKFWQSMSWCHRDIVTINDHTSFYIKVKFVWGH